MIFRIKYYFFAILFSLLSLNMAYGQCDNAKLIEKWGNSTIGLYGK